MFLSVQWNQLKINSCEVYLEGELLIEDRVEGLPVDLGLKLLLLVRQQVDLYVWIRCTTHVHSRQLCRLDDPHYELKGKTKVKKQREGMSDCPLTQIIPIYLNLHPTNILTDKPYID